jgi:hypothetical protein
MALQMLPFYVTAMNGCIYKNSMSFMRLGHMGTSYHGIPNLFKDPGTFADNLVVLVKCLYIVNWK